MTTSRRKSSTGSGRSQNKGGARRPATQRAQAGPPSLTMAHAKGFLVGAVAGTILGAAGVTYLNKETADAPNIDAVDAAATAEARPKPRFDFYTLLPNQDLDFSSDVEPAQLDTKHRDNDLYVLQAGAFRAERDADRRRGELALLGLEATIEQTRGDNGVWYRVYLGPFESHSAMAKARTMTAQQSIDTLLLKRPRNP